MLLVLLGSELELGPVAAIMIGAVVCCAAAVAGDNLQDLKCGYLVGATPWRQQVMLAIGVDLLRARDGAGAEPAERDATASACRRRASESAAGAAGDADGHGRARAMFGGDLPWTMIGDRRRDRRRRSSRSTPC